MTTNEDKYKGKGFKGNKFTYVRDELGFNYGGIYAFTPYDNISGDKRTLIKVGMTNNFNRRFDGYYTSFPDGVFVIALLQDPVDNIDSVEVRTHNKHAENYVIEELIRNKQTKRVKSKTRITNADEDGGQTEWFYTTPNIVKAMFERAFKKFKGLSDGRKTKLETYNNNIVKDTQEKMNSGKPYFEGKIITFV